MNLHLKHAALAESDELTHYRLLLRLHEILRLMYSYLCFCVHWRFVVILCILLIWPPDNHLTEIIN